jgi:hypothetical protein
MSFLPRAVREQAQNNWAWPSAMKMLDAHGIDYVCQALQPDTGVDYKQTEGYSNVKDFL